MTNVEKLDRLGKLGDVRQRVGAKDENDTSRDQKINRYSSEELTAYWAGWHLGDDGWGRAIISMYQALEGMK